jgi:CDP-glycerol glycerophosphotransferase (TagB/SpsB family)
MSAMEWIWLFGASRMGERAYAQLCDRFHVAGFIDNDPNKQGQSFLGVPVIPLELLGKQKHADHIVICSLYVFEIMQQLLESGIHQFSVFEVAHGAANEACHNLVPCAFDSDWRELNEQSLALFVHNASGSNTHALAKLGQLEADWQVACGYDGRGSADWYQMYMTSRNFVCTHDLVVPSDRAAVQLWHGVPLKGLNYMSRFQTAVHRTQHQKYWANYKGIASYSATYTTLMNACFGGGIEQYAVTGMPRNDFLFCANGKQLFEQVSGRSIDDRKLVAYMPTFRTTAFGQVNGGENSSLFDFSDFDLDALVRFLDSNQLTMLLKMHPYEIRGGDTMQSMAGSEAFCIITDDMLAAAQVDFYEMLNAVDLLITDYSSVYFDYLLLDRPIVFTPTDLDQYAATRGFLMEPYDFWAPGVKCLTQGTLMRTLDSELAHPEHHAADRDRVAEIVHHYRDGKSSQRVASLIQKRLRH